MKAHECEITHVPIRAEGYVGSEYAPLEAELLFSEGSPGVVHPSGRHIEAAVHISPQMLGPQVVVCPDFDCPICQRGTLGTEVTHLMKRITLYLPVLDNCVSLEFLFPWFNGVYSSMVNCTNDLEFHGPVDVIRMDGGYCLDCRGWHADPDEHESGTRYPPNHPPKRMVVRDDCIVEIGYADGTSVALPILQKRHLAWLWSQHSNPTKKLPWSDIWMSQDEAMEALGFNDEEIFWSCLERRCFLEYSVDGRRKFYHKAEITAFALNLENGLWVMEQEVVCDDGAMVPAKEAANV